MKTLTVEQLDKVIQYINSFNYKPTEKMDVILSTPLTVHNVYKMFDILNDLYPVQYTKEQYVNYMVSFLKQITFDVNYNLINIKYLQPILTKVGARLDTSRSIYNYACLLCSSNLLNSSKLKQISVALHNTEYSIKFFDLCLQYLIQDTNTIKDIKFLIKNTYTSPLIHIKNKDVEQTNTLF